MRRLFALALLLAFAAACQQDSERQAATAAATTTATTTTVEPTTTTKPPATPAEKAWIADVRKLRQRLDRTILRSGVVTQASLGWLRPGSRSGRSRQSSPSPSWRSRVQCW
jgi:hypothetical protein